MTSDRTEENRAAVVELLQEHVGSRVQVRTGEPETGLYFHLPDLNVRLHVGEQLLADSTPEDLERRLLTDRVDKILKSERSAQVLAAGTAAVP